LKRRRGVFKERQARRERYQTEKQRYNIESDYNEFKRASENNDYVKMSAIPPPSSNYPPNGMPPPMGMPPPNGLPPGAIPPPGQGQQQQGPPSSYFTDSRKGEVNELRMLLKNFSIERDPKRKRDIIKKVIAYMTLGIDVSRLFSEMMLAIETRDLVIKKMVYLFLCNYATTHPELAQMCTNTLQKDCSNDDPMVRGLALRALCSLRLPQMVEYISEPLRRSLTDSHAYVRKTGVMGILKLWHLDVEAFERCNFIDILYDMLRDPDASVVTNCIIVLNEVMAKSPNGGMAINRQIMLHLLNRIHEFSEFGITAVIDLVPRYRPYDDNEAYQIMNLLDPVLRTSNSSAVMATIRGFLAVSEHVNQGKDKEEMMRQVAMRIKASIITLVTGAIPELMFCLLTHIHKLVSICPGVFDDEYRQFYVRYNEATHVKYLKVQILCKLANAENANDIIAEVGEYVNDSNVKLSRLAIRGMASIACRPNTGDKTEEAVALRLVEMLDLDVGHVPAEAAIALADVIRKHSYLKEIICHRLPRALRYVKEPDGKAAVIWLLGECGDNVSDAPYAIEKVIDSYHEIKDAKVKMALLTATMKLFFKRPPEVHKMLGKLLVDSTEDVSNQDLHDRALLYHRLLKASPKVAEAVVGAASPQVPLEKGFAEEDDFETKAELMKEFNSLSILYGKVSENFIAEEYRVKLVIMPDEHIETSRAAAAYNDTDNNISGVQEQLEQTVLNDTNNIENPVVASEPAPAPYSDPAPVVESNTAIGDLLDFGDSPSPAPISPPSSITFIPNFTMTGDEYQAIWGANTEAVNTNLGVSVLPSSTSDVETALSSANISTMASGELETEFKFFLYCKEDSGTLFLLQVAISKSAANPQVSLIIKTDGANERATLVLESFRKSLSAFVG